MSFREPCHMPFHKLIPPFYPHRASVLHIPIEHADNVSKLFVIPPVVVSLAIRSLECIHNSAVHDEAFTMCFIRKFIWKRLNLLTDSKEKRSVLLLLLLLLLSPRAVRAMAWDHSLRQSCFLSITIFRWINSLPAPINMDFTIILEYTFSQFQEKNISLTVRKKIYSP